MGMAKRLGFAVAVLCCLPALAIEKPGVTYKVFQFPANMIPRIDGNADDWSMVPEEYAIGMDQLVDDSKLNAKPDPKNLDVRVKVGWVKGLNRLFFLYEAYDNYWDFARPGLTNDIFELVVDGDMSGGGVIERYAPNAKAMDPMDVHFTYHGVFAQNYHIMTPAVNKDWALAWGCNPYVKELPYANVAYNYNFKPGESGKLIMELMITPFDYAGCEGPERAVESKLWENKLIGISWAVLDYDGQGQQHAFWNLSSQHTMYGNADQLVAFKLMPLEDRFKKAIDARWSFQVVDMSRRLVAFKDLSGGKITSWKWEFGDGATSTEQNPIHAYPKSGEYTVTLSIEGPAGTSKMEKVWDVVMR